MSEAESLTDLIRRAQDGDEAALRIVFDATYAELRGLARARLRKGSRNTLLDTTSLVHEAFLRFADAGRLHIGDRQHFLRYASHVMRSVIVDFVREKLAQRRGGDAVHVTLELAKSATRRRRRKRNPAGPRSAGGAWRNTTRAWSRWSKCAISPA